MNSPRTTSRPARRRVFIVASGVVSPYGIGQPALERGVESGRSATVRRDFGAIGNLAVGACEEIADVFGEDRSITVLQAAIEQIRAELNVLSSVVPAERRGACAGTSKLAMMLLIEDPSRAAERFSEIVLFGPGLTLARAFDARGPVQSLTAACATALNNICRAADWVAYGDADCVLAGATDAALTPMYVGSLLALGAMTRDECRPFDARHSGFVAGEGAAVLALASEDVVVRSGLTPLAEISGWCTGSDAFHATGCDTSGKGIASVLNRALNHAGNTAQEMDLLGAHGTATLQSDAAESAALSILYDGKKTPPLALMKGAIGHLMGACGSVEFAACLHSLKTQTAYPVMNWETHAPGYEHLTLLKRRVPTRIKNILKWNSGFGGQIAACVIRAV